MTKLLTTLSILLIATSSYAQTYTVERVIDGEVPIQAEFSNKIVYTEDAGADTSILNGSSGDTRHNLN